MIFAVSLLLLIAFTLPIATIALEKTSDVSNSLNVKSEVSKLSNAISKVYAEGQGSKQSVYLDMNTDVSLRIHSSYIQTRLPLSDGSYKEIKIPHNSNFVSETLILNKGENIIIVEWPAGSEKMLIFKHL